MKTKKGITRILAFMLALLMVISTVEMTAFTSFAAERDEFETSEEVSEEISEEVSYSEMFPGLATMSVISEANLAQGTEMKNNIKFITELQEGIDCVPNEVMVTVESEELALEYAKAFNGTLKLFDENFAVIELNANRDLPHASVAQAVMASVDSESMLPVGWPNYYRYTFDEPADENFEFRVAKD